MTRILLLDVGHGNCAVVSSEGSTVVIDSPVGTTLLDTLRDLGVDTVETAIISHADKDHIAGVLSLLTSETIKVRTVYVNPDSQKNTKVWRDFRAAVAVAERKGTCNIIPTLSTMKPGTINAGNARVSVICPTAALALTGVGGSTAAGREVGTNTLSGVLRVEHADKAGSVLLAADLDEVGLEEALSAGTVLKADVLVFPHHGGSPGHGDPASFASKLLDAVDPSVVVFSNGRGRHDNPRSSIISSVLMRGCAIACTQLSERCHAKTVDVTGHLEPLRGLGRKVGSSCAGSISVEFGKTAHRPAVFVEQHQRFISDQVSSPMCRLAP